MTVTKHPRRYGIQELAQASGVPRRTIRYYVQLGLVPPPKGAGRGHYYEREHLELLLRIRELRDRGRSLEEVREALAAGGGVRRAEAPAPRHEVVTRVQLAAGLVLEVGPGRRPPTPARLRALATAAARILGANDEVSGVT